MATQARRFDVEPALVRERNVWAGVRLWTGGMAFLFVSFLFAFLYLRSLNNDQMWRPKGVNPPVVFGSIVLVCQELGTVFADPHVVSRASIDASRTDPFDNCPICGRVATAEFRPATSEEIRGLGFRPGEYA